MESRPWPGVGAACATLRRADFAQLPGFDGETFGAAFRAFQASALALEQHVPAGRPGVEAEAALRAAGVCALQHRAAVSEAEARGFFMQHFVPWRIDPRGAPGFVTGYYEPELDAARERSGTFTAPVPSRPADLVTFAPGQTPAPLDASLAAARRLPDGTFAPYDTRAQIDAQAPQGAQPLAWLRDSVELFLVQVQGSARLRLPGGQVLRLGYAGRNGHPYVSIGRWLINAGAIAEADMSLARLKQWLRAQPDGGRSVMARNPSYVFFTVLEGLDPLRGPLAAASVQLAALCSIAVDRTLWPYGLPFWLDARLPWAGEAATPFQQLMIAQDTGSAIVGPARADIFFGMGDAAGLRAGAIRHAASMHVLLPKAQAAA